MARNKAYMHDFDGLSESRRASIFLAIRSLSFREREVLIELFGLRDGKQKTLASVALIFKIGTERVRQIKQKSIRLLQSRFVLDGGVLEKKES